MAGAEIVAVGRDHQLAVGRTGGRGHELNLREAGRGTIECKPGMGDGMRFDRDHRPGGADMARQNHGVGADVGADIDEHPADRRIERRRDPGCGTARD